MAQQARAENLNFVMTLPKPGKYSLKSWVVVCAVHPYPIYDPNLQYALPYLSPDQKFETLLMT